MLAIINFITSQSLKSNTEGISLVQLFTVLGTFYHINLIEKDAILIYWSLMLQDAKMAVSHALKTIEKAFKAG